MSNPVSHDLVEQKLRQRAGYMREAGHDDDADLDIEAAAQIAALSAANSALMAERNNLADIVNSGIDDVAGAKLDELEERATDAESKLAALSAERDALEAEKLVGWVETIGNENDRRASEWKARATTAEAQLKAVTAALARYDQALANREHGGAAAHRCVDDLRAALNPKAPS